MNPVNKIKLSLFFLFTFTVFIATAQSILPPEIPWSGKSESLITKADNLWITPTEKSGFATTPDYNETMSWLKRLSQATKPKGMRG